MQTSNLIFINIINILVKNGNKEIAKSIVQKGLAFIKKTTKQQPKTVIINALLLVYPFCEVRSLKISGTIYKVPIEINLNRQKMLAIRFIIESSKKRPEKSFWKKFSLEILDTLNQSSRSIKACDEFHKIAESNKIFIQYRN
uniref:Ribosomal protein S7 n=1 Tax=Proteomonas sulcata TaxID=77928 RepID=A0A2P1G8B2_9CRYP|nr:ribosomal protein S7 [Proteomonas sulcata]AVM81192.1 ribosomal protein S7 [Proteomonas sulcata]